MNAKIIFSAIASFGIIAFSSLPASARDAVLRANFADSTINMRAIPSVNAPLRGFGVPGDRVRILNQRIGSNRNQWYYIESARTGASGWVDGTYVRQLASRQPAIGGRGLPPGPIIDRNQRYLVDDYEARVFPSGRQTRINVYNRRMRRTEINREPVTVNRTSDGVAYTGRNVELFVHNDGRRSLTFF
ncbi:SH3 domain-containing protein [Leptolyngbya sp. AN03gr2]|uniref:SH3 domain-containing protein n=1 Tax=unclassified Leptolyngbya TaxID=2650499 RepID=UPI003D320B61